MRRARPAILTTRTLYPQSSSSSLLLPLTTTPTPSSTTKPTSLRLSIQERLQQRTKRPANNGTSSSGNRSVRLPIHTTMTPTDLRNRTMIVTFIAALVILGVKVHFESLLMTTSSLEARTSHGIDEWDVAVHNHTAPNVQLLRKEDYEQYTIRINTWQRPRALQASLLHHVSCPGVAQIQVVWCTAQGPVPDWLWNFHDKVVVEEHDINSLNERFRIRIRPLTAGILSLDDDVIRPCIAYDWAFRKWTLNPDRMVGFDARSHDVSTTEGNRWRYAYMSTTERSNAYSLTLTRSCFLHVNYLHWYTGHPRYDPIRAFVAEHLNCEDIGMSFLVSSLTRGQPPLLADYWAVKSMVKLSNGASAGGESQEYRISADKDHKLERDDCVESFAELLELKDTLRLSTLSHGTYFQYGDRGLDWNQPWVSNNTTAITTTAEYDGTTRRDKNNNSPRPIISPGAPHLRDAQSLVEHWMKHPELLPKELAALRMNASWDAYERGLVEGSEPWRQKHHVVSSET